MARATAYVNTKGCPSPLRDSSNIHLRPSQLIVLGLNIKAFTRRRITFRRPDAHTHDLHSSPPTNTCVMRACASNESSNDIQCHGLVARTHGVQYHSYTSWHIGTPFPVTESPRCIHALLEKLADVLSGRCRWPDEKSATTFHCLTTGSPKLFPLPCLACPQPRRRTFH